MYACMYERMHVYVYVELYIYESVSVSTFNQIQILTKLDKSYATAERTRAKFTSVKKSDGARNFVVGETKINFSM
jgi:hypothetical protein